jgi:hypothetical protein
MRHMKWRPLEGQALNPTALPSDIIKYDLIVYKPPGTQFVLQHHSTDRAAR